MNLKNSSLSTRYLFVQPGGFIEHVQLVIEWVPLHVIPVGLEVWGAADVNPIEVFGHHPLDLVADPAAFCRVHCSPPLPNQLCWPLILQSHIVRGSAGEEAERAMVDIHQGGEILQGLLEFIPPDHLVQPSTLIHD